MCENQEGNLCEDMRKQECALRLKLDCLVRLEQSVPWYDFELNAKPKRKGRKEKIGRRYNRMGYSAYRMKPHWCTVRNHGG